MSFIYSLIANQNKVILAEETEYNGNFQQIIRSILHQNLQEGKIIINYDK